MDSIERQTAAAASSQLERVISTMLTLRGVVAASPDMTNAQFLDWYRGANMAVQSPGGMGFAYIVRVPYPDLAAFGVRQVADPVTGLPTSDPFSVFSDNAGDEYCLQRLAIWQLNTIASFAIPAGYDMCTATVPGVGVSPMPQLLAASTSTGTASVFRDDQILPTTMGITLPVYRGGDVPPTEALRQEASIGWVSATFDRNILVAAADDSNSQLAVAVERRNPDGSVTTLASVDQVVASAEDRETVVAIQNQGDWQVRVVGTPPDDGLSAGAQAIVVFLLGAALGVLAFLLIRMLGGSRNRALALVELKTGELEFQALHDGLTGLPNRVLVLDRAEQMMARARQDDGEIAALFIDLDDFKSVNDTLGHGAGDDLLRAVATRLSNAVRSNDTVGRVGGDELVILLDGTSMRAGVEVVADRLLAALAEPFLLSGQSRTVTASIGIAVGLRDTADEWLRDADVALYEKKAAGKNGFVVFEPTMREAVEDRVELEQELHRAVVDQQFHLLYQPTFDLRTNSPTGVEALIRWRHPTRGIVPPDEFIPVVEKNGLIVPIGSWVLHEACRQAIQWRDSGHPLQMAVNVSARQLDDEGFVNDVRATLDATGLEPTSLVLEVTETTLMFDPEATQHRLEALRSIGVRIAIDDFGTGYSSLAYLRQFPVDTIKIDRSFIAAMTTTDEGQALIHTLIQLASTLGLETVAEGIESIDQLDLLRHEHCDSGQGYLYSRPLDPVDLEAFLVVHESREPHPIG